MRRFGPVRFLRKRPALLGAGPTSTRWRILIETTQVLSAWPIAREIELKGVAGGPDLATGGTATANVGTAANAFDDNSTTFWQGNASRPAWVEYAKAVPWGPIEQVTWHNSAMNDGIVTGKVQWWDGAAWQTYWSFTFPTWTANDQLQTITRGVVGTRYRVRALTAGTNNALGINELQMFASNDATGTNLATLSGGNGAIGSHNDGSYPLVRIFDGNTSNFWTSLGVASPVGGHWAGMRFAGVQAIRSFRVMFRNGFNEWPSSYWVERSTDDGVTWEVMTSGGGLAGGVWHTLTW